MFSKCTALLTFLGCLCGCSPEEKTSTRTEKTEPRHPPEERKAYPAMVAASEEGRKNFAVRWGAADADQQAAIIAEARSFIEKSIIDDLFPYWIGTPWDFNGVTQVPGCHRPLQNAPP